MKSSIADPSRKNSGLETTSKNFWSTLFDIIFFTSLVVPTGTVDLVTTKQYFFILSEISSATCHTKLKSASSSNLLVGVPTVIKKISVFSELFFMLEAKDFLIRNNVDIETHLIQNCDHHIPIEASSIALSYIKKKFYNL